MAGVTGMERETRMVVAVSQGTEVGVNLSFIKGHLPVTATCCIKGQTVSERAKSMYSYIYRFSSIVYSCCE
jgi:hypothetical protein